MKKLLTLVVCCSLSAPSFGVDWNRDRIYISIPLSIEQSAIGYHYTDDVKVLIQPVGIGALVNLQYRYEFTNTDITPYISAGMGATKADKYYFLYKVSAGANLPLSERTSIFAGYSVLGMSSDYNHGIELGVSFNL
ncbi:MAG: outer membrane protein [Wolbachia sp.]